MEECVLAVELILKLLSGTKQYFSKTRKLCIVANYCMLAYLVQARPTMLLASV